jgi:hypothetical protein
MELALSKIINTGMLPQRFLKINGTYSVNGNMCHSWSDGGDQAAIFILILD